MILSFTVPGDVRAWARARLGNIRGRPVHFTDTKTRNYEGMVKMLGTEGMDGHPPFDRPVSMSLVVRRVPPASTSKVKRLAMLAGTIRPGMKPDADNHAKIIGDGLNRIAYTDDALICDLHVSKVYAETAGVDVTVMLL